MRPSQCHGEGDALSGDLCTGRVRKSERRSDGDCGSREASGGDDNRRLTIRANAHVMVWPGLKPVALGMHLGLQELPHSARLFRYPALKQISPI